MQRENIFFSRGDEKQRKKRRKYLEKISPKIVKDIEKSQFQSRSRDICQFLEGFNFGFGEFGLGKKYVFWFQKIWSRKKVSVSVLENLVSEKKSRYRFRSKFWYRHSVLGCKPLLNCWVTYYYILTARVIQS